jgi:hypothetical protein
MAQRDVSFRISRKNFWFITFLIVLLPISSKYRLLIFGKRTQGVVVANEVKSSAFYQSHGYDTYPVIEFTTDSLTLRMYGPENASYEVGHRFTVIYNPDNPYSCMILTLSYFYTGRGVILPGTIMLLWISFYLTFRSRDSKNHPRRGKRDSP